MFTKGTPWSAQICYGIKQTDFVGPFSAAQEMHVAFGTKALVTRMFALSMRVLFVQESPQMNSEAGEMVRFKQTGG